jgi:GAF domain-containing protein
MAQDDQWKETALRLEELSRDLAEVHDVEESLEGALRVAVELGPCDIASVSLRRASGEIETTAASHPVAARSHEIQQRLGQGPCIEVDWGDSDLHVVSNIADEDRWPQWVPEAESLGLRSMLAVRLFTSRQTVGALDLYSRSRRSYDEDDILTARLIAARVSSALAEMRHEESLWQAIDARHDVGIAQGLLMERFGIDRNQAFGVLRRYSQESHRKLREVAHEVVNTRRLPAADSSLPESQPSRSSRRRRSL